MKYYIKFEAYGQLHEDVWVGCKSEAHIRAVISEITSTAHIHIIQKIDNDEKSKPSRKAAIPHHEMVQNENKQVNGQRQSRAEIAAMQRRVGSSHNQRDCQRI